MQTIYPSILLVWGGMVLGLSFIGTPAKFLAPHLTLPLALEVGKVTFHTFNKVEWATLFITCVLCFFHEGPFIKWGAVGLVFFLLLFQTFWLLPVLDQRVDMVILGDRPEESIDHWLYIIVELVKIVTLIGGGVYLVFNLVADS